MPLRSIVAAFFLFLILACFPYVKAYMLSGNPVYPFGNDYFKSPYIDEDLRDYRYEEKLTWRAPMQVTFETDRYYEGQDGSFGFQYILLLPLCIVVVFLGRDPAARVAALTGLVGAMVIIAIQPNARYLYPALPYLTIGAAAALGYMQSVDRSLLHVTTAALIAITLMNVRVLPTANWYHRDFFLRPFFRRAWPSGVHSRNRPGPRSCGLCEQDRRGRSFYRGFRHRGRSRSRVFEYLAQLPIPKADGGCKRRCRRARRLLFLEGRAPDCAE